MVRFSDMSRQHQEWERVVFGRRSSLHRDDSAILSTGRYTREEEMVLISAQRAERAVRREVNRLAKIERTARVAARKASPGTRRRYPRRSFRSLCNGSDMLRAAALGVLLN